jgi:hypothetical protein
VWNFPENLSQLAAWWFVRERFDSAVLLMLKYRINLAKLCSERVAMMLQSVAIEFVSMTGSVYWTVGKNVTVKASNFNGGQQLSTNRPQQV